MTREYETLDAIEVDDQSTAPTKVLSTYGGIDTSTKNYFFHIVFTASVLLLIVSLPLAFVYVPSLSSISDYRIDKGDKCWVSSTTKCENHLQAHIYFWNVTNPSQVLAGTHAPALEQVGPYVLKDTINKRQNITFSDDDSEVSFVSTLYADVDVSSCKNCSLTDEIVSFNLAYIGMVKTAGSETNILATLLPFTLSTLVDGIATVFGGIGTDATLGQYFPAIASAAASGMDDLRALAVSQIFSLAPLGGYGLLDLPALGVPASFIEAFAVAPEYAVYASSTSGLSVGIIDIESPISESLYDAITADTTGMTAAGILTMDITTLSTTFFVDATQAALIQGYLVYLMLNYGAPEFVASLGPALGAHSSGILIKRSVQEWIFGYEDPLVSLMYPANDPRKLIRSVTKIRNISTIDEDHVPWLVADSATWASEYGSTPFTLATGVGAPKNATKVLKRSDGSGPIIYPYSGHREEVIGKDIATGQYSSIKENGPSVDVHAWADFGMGLDLRRSLTLRHAPGRAVKKNDKVSVETYTIAYEDLLPCPVNQTACDRNTQFHGTFNVTGFGLIPSVYTLPHGYRADPRVFGGYINPTSSDCPFSPDPTVHDIEFEIYARTGNTLSMKVPIQQNFKIEPTDVLYTTLWSGATPGDQPYIPISWTSLEYDMPEDFYTSIKDTVTHMELLVATWTYICPAICAMGILFSGVHLYIRRALNRRLVDEDRHAREAIRGDSRAIGSFRDAGLVSALKQKDRQLVSTRDDAAPASVNFSNVV